VTERLLWLLRHAKTVPDPPPGQTDHERPLAPRGRRDADALGRRLGPGGDRLGLPAGSLPTLVLCSTATRTVQTAERVLTGMADAPGAHGAAAPAARLECRRALYGASPERVIGEIRTVSDEIASLMVVGHNPSFHSLAAGMAAPDDRPPGDLGQRGFPTCAVAVYRLPTGGWGDVAEGTGTLLGWFTPPY